MAGKGKEVDGCPKCAKWCLFVFNVIFCLIGVGLVATGIYAYIELKDLVDIVGKNINAPAIVLIVFGFITFIIAAIGCLGAWKESACLLFMFATIISILLIAEIAAGGAAFYFRGRIEGWIAENASLFMKDYNESNTGNIKTKAWNTLQTKLECCGLNSSADWNSPSAPNQNGTPKSCGSNTAGCLGEAVKFLKKNIVAVAGVGIAFGLIEFLGIVLACCVGCNIRKTK